MSHYKIRDIEIREGKMFIESSPNNIEPLRFRNWECTWINPERHSDIYDSCIDAFVSGDFQLENGCQGKVADAVRKTLKKMGEPFWRTYDEEGYIYQSSKYQEEEKRRMEIIYKDFKKNLNVLNTLKLNEIKLKFYGHLVPLNELFGYKSYGWDDHFEFVLRNTKHPADFREKLVNAYIDTRVAGKNSKRVVMFEKQRKILLEAFDKGYIYFEGMEHSTKINQEIVEKEIQTPNKKSLKR